MSNKIIYFDDALLEVKEAKAWYKKQQEGLQKKFAIAIKKTIIRVQNHPTAFAIRYKNIRIAHPDTFPYGIHFYFDPNKQEIGIVGIIHESRDETASDRLRLD